MSAYGITAMSHRAPPCIKRAGPVTRPDGDVCAAPRGDPTYAGGGRQCTDYTGIFLPKQALRHHLAEAAGALALRKQKEKAYYLIVMR
jgi:hypothetical protein